MKLNSLRVCEEASRNLSFLKGRTGLTPNILCRIGFMMSIKDPTRPNPDNYLPDSDRIIERPVLTGAWDTLFVALIKERCLQDGLPLDDDVLGEQFKAHVNRGVLLLYKRVKTLNDLALIMPRSFWPTDVERDDQNNDEDNDLS